MQLQVFILIILVQIKNPKGFVCKLTVCIVNNVTTWPKLTKYIFKWFVYNAVYTCHHKIVPSRKIKKFQLNSLTLISPG